jgi:hypothetical protein
MIQVILSRPVEESQLNIIKRAGLTQVRNHGTVGALPNIYEKEIENSIRITGQNHNSFSDINLNLTNALLSKYVGYVYVSSSRNN